MQVRRSRASKVHRSGLTPQNYEFRPLDQDDLDLVKIAIKPLRKDRMLDEGTIFLARAGGDLIRIAHVRIAGSSVSYDLRLPHGKGQHLLMPRDDRCA